MTPSDAPASISPDEPPTAPPSDAIVHSDLPCRDCGYNLRTLSHDQRCPECGLSVRWSAQGYQLKYARLSWLRQLRWGCDLIIVHFIFSTIAFLAFMGMVDTDSFRTNLRWLVLWAGAFAIAVTCGIAGAWLLTKVEPDQRSRRRPRYSLLVRLFLPMVGLACGLFVLTTLELKNLHPFVMNWLHFGLILLWTLVVIAATMLLLMLHLAELVRRASSSAVRATFVGLYYSFVMSIVFFLLMLLFRAARFEWGIAVCLFLFLGFLWAHLFCYLVACVELRSELQNAIAFGVSAREKP